MNYQGNQYRMAQIERILYNPDMYLGNMTLINGMSEGLKYILLRGLSGSANVEVSDPYIEVTIDDNIIAVKDKGTYTLHRDGNLYRPETIFGPYISNNDLVDVAMINIFSRAFRVEIGNLEEHRHYDQLWENNARIKFDPIITEYHGPDFVKISFELDFELFGCTSLTQEMINVLGAYCQTIDPSIALYGYFGNESVKEPGCV